MLPSVALTLQGIPGWTIDEKERTLTLDIPEIMPPESTTGTYTAEPEVGSMTLHNVDDEAEDGAEVQAQDSTITEQQDTPAPPNTDKPLPSVPAQPTPSQLERARTTILAQTTAAMRATNHFQVLSKWRNELYPIYWRDPLTSQRTLLCSIERSASCLFGVVTYGVHMTAYTYTAPSSASSSADGKGNDREMQIYVPRRSRTKQTYPSLLDQTVAGGISTGETAFESLVRESEEEACLPASLVRRKAISAGAVTYFHIRDSRAGGETRLLMPECQFVYDLDLSGESDEEGKPIVPRPGDDEVEAFELMSVEAVQRALANGEFKPNCALVVLDFLVRHGVVTRENEAFYAEICARLRRRLEFPCL